MLINNLKVAFRYLINHKSYTFINLAGLTLGFFCFLLLNFYVSSEENVDSQLPQSYRLLQQVTDENGSVRETAASGPQIGLSAKTQFPEIEAVSQILVLGRLTVGNEHENRQYVQISTIDPGFFEVFNFRLLEGDPQHIFEQPNGIVLTESDCKRFLGEGPYLGKTLRTNVFDAIVAGVLPDFPDNTHMTADLMLPNSTAATVFKWWDSFTSDNWHRNSFVTYFKLRPDANASALAAKIENLAKQNWPADAPFRSSFSLQPVQDIHLYPATVEGEIVQSKGNALYVRIFFWVALVILLVACFNYTGLLNVSFMGRAKEIGVRKTIGASGGQLLRQFFTESLLLTGAALLLTIALLQTAEPQLSLIFGKSFDWSALPALNLLGIVIAALAISMLSIIYPAYLVHRMQAIHALRDQRKSAKRMPFYKVMTVCQFVVAIALIAITLIFHQQVQYLQTKTLGFEKDGLLVADINSGNLRSNFAAIKQEFSALPDVQHVSVSSRVPGEWKDFPLVSVRNFGAAGEQSQPMIFVGADKDFLNTFQVKLLEGRNFDGNPADSTNVLLNESAAQRLGLAHPVGEIVEIPSVNWSGDDNPLDETFRATVIGVVADFHFEDFRQEIKPMVIGFRNNPIQNIDYFTLRISTANWATLLASLKNINNDFDPENPLEYHFLDAQFERFFEADLLRSRMLMFFSGIVIFIACMGLFAMATFTLRRRTKEIGIRKVLGAGVGQIVRLVVVDFFWLILIGAAVAIPASWLVMDRWLAEFAYQVNIGWWMFAAAVALTLLIALLTIGWQVIRASLANPVKSLRYE